MELTYRPESGEDFWDELEAKRLQEGRYEALGCIAYVRAIQPPNHCRTCQCEPVEAEVNAASLWGIVIDVDDRHGYKRQIEHEMAFEAGVVADPFAGKKAG